MRLKLCDITQQLEYLSIDKVKQVLEEKTCIRDYAYIIHDKDVDDRGVLKEPHIHLALRLNNSYDTKHIAQWFGIAENYVQKVKGKWVDVLKYLTHENAKEKYQYSNDDVVSNFDFVEEIKNSSKPKDKPKDERRSEIINKIVAGEIREFNYTEHITVEELDKYKKSIDNAYKYRQDKFEGVDRLMECYFITGESGTGKTTYAKQIAQEKGYSIFVSSGSNDVLDGYKGQDCIILDDLRPSCMGLSDLLKMLDNHTASTVKSRYKNKSLFECRLIIITTVLPIDTFFGKVFDNEEEPIVQLKRRCNIMLHFYKEEYACYVYDEYKRDYSYVGNMPNPVYLKYSLSTALSREEQLRRMASALNMTADMVGKLTELQPVKLKEQQEWDDI